MEDVVITGIRPGSSIFDTYVIVMGQPSAEDLQVRLLQDFGSMLATDGYFSRFGSTLTQNISVNYTVVNHQPVTADQFQVTGNHVSIVQNILVSSVKNIMSPSNKCFSALPQVCTLQCSEHEQRLQNCSCACESGWYRNQTANVTSSCIFSPPDTGVHGLFPGCGKHVTAVHSHHP